MARRWAFTLQLQNVQDPATEYQAMLQDLLDAFSTTISTPKRSLTYIVIQIEMAPTSGQLHVQGAISLSQPTRLMMMKKFLPTAHWEQARDWNRLVAYCKKEESRVAGPWEWGSPPSGQGSRTDLKLASAMIQSGSTMKTIAQQMPEVIVKYHKGLLYLKSLQEQSKYKPKKVGLFYGMTGSGKTLTAHEELDDLYTVFDIKTPWFDGYQGESSVLMDECGIGMMNYNYLKRILDGYRMDVPIKGGSVAWTPDTIILTSNIPLEEWYPFIPKEDLWALERRIRKFEFPKDKQLAVAWLRGTLIQEPPAKRDTTYYVEEQLPPLPDTTDWLQEQQDDLFGTIHSF